MILNNGVITIQPAYSGLVTQQQCKKQQTVLSLLRNERYGDFTNDLKLDCLVNSNQSQYPRGNYHDN